MLFADELVPYLREFNEQTGERFQRIVEQMTQAEGVTEQLKKENQLEWVRRMNDIAAQARESVLSEMVYQ